MEILSVVNTIDFQAFIQKEMFVNVSEPCVKVRIWQGLRLLAITEFQTIVLFSLVPVILAFIFLVFVLYRMRRESQIRQREAEYRQRVAQVEMKALRSQMNPHFIFNSLNSIYLFILQKRPDEAADYLLKFSKLMRSVLENSMHKEVLLKEELEALELYMQLEQLRVPNGFDVEVKIAEDLDPDAVYVPPLLLQPFVENSIWHGLSARPDKGKIIITIKSNGDRLQLVVEDNGRMPSGDATEKPAVGKKKKSLGMSITRERLELLNQGSEYKSTFIIEDIKDANDEYAGKRVLLDLPFLEDN